MSIRSSTAYRTRYWTNDASVSRLVMLPMRSNDLCTPSHTACLISSGVTIFTGPSFDLPIVPSANTHLVEPSDSLCQVSPSLAPSALTDTSSTVSPSGSTSDRVLPEVFTSVNVGSTTRNSPGDRVPERSVPLRLDFVPYSRR